MANGNAKRTIEFKSQPRIIVTSSMVGKREGDGKLGKYFHKVVSDDMQRKTTFEKAERMFLHETIEDAVTSLTALGKELQLIVGGDLLNQIISTSFVAREMHLPLIGLYSACSTMSESLLVGAMMVDGKYYDNIACCTVSHFSSAERQYRFPLEQGIQRPLVSQWTVTGAGCCILSADQSDYPKITRACVGEVVDYGVTDVNNMGAAMAPAAMNTLFTFFEETKTQPEDYDLILTGDLGVLGSSILVDLMKDRNYSIEKQHKDCGAMIFEGIPHNYQGGSGAGCSASVFSSYIYKQLKDKSINKMLFIATGALLSTTSSQQGESIPGIAHLVEIHC